MDQDYVLPYTAGGKFSAFSIHPESEWQKELIGLHKKITDLFLSNQGMVLAKENRRFMRENGIVLYLSAPAEVLASRLQANPNAAQRPTLTGKSIAEEVAEVLAAREPLYRETATHILNAAATPKELLAEALAILKP